jgi:deazaflavin-dependent oxidoreductase (nitroreductase family)
VDARKMFWKAARGVVDGHVALYRASGGRVGHNLPGAPPMLLLDHVGAKSRKKRTSPLGYFTDGDDVVVIASKGGDPRHPAWYHNLMANPETTIQLGTEQRAVHARTAAPEERKRLWARAVEIYGGYRGYQERTKREIPLVILERRGPP